MKYLLVAILSLTTHLFLGYYIMVPIINSPFYWWTIPVVLILSAVIVATLILGGIFFHISTHAVSKYHTLSSALLHYVFEYGMLRNGRAAMKKLKVESERAREVQEVLLKQILKQKKDTIYGKKFKFSEVKNMSDFRRKQPLTNYEHYKPYIQRIADGEDNILTQETPCRLLLTSGTTGEAKTIPALYSFMKNDHADFGGMVSAIAKENFPNWQLMQKHMYFYCNPKMTKSKGGIPIGPLTAIPDWARSLLMIYSTPADGFNICTFHESTYIHLLFGLRDRDISVMMAGLSTTLLSAMQQLEEQWEQLVEDLRCGTIDAKLELPLDIRKGLTKELGGGDQDRAEELREEFEEGFEGIIGRIWPNIAYIMCIDIANLKEILDETYVKDVPMYSQAYGATEGIIGMNITPLEEEPEYVLTPSYTVYEFIAENDISDPDPTATLFIDEVEVGKNYEIVFSQKSGLFRYRFGDVVQISGFYQNCPKVKFLYRSGALLNMCGEKLNPTMVLESLHSALEDSLSKLELYQYAVAESIMLTGSGVCLKVESGQQTKPYYIFFLELTAESYGTCSTLNDMNFSKKVDKSLCRKHHIYKHFKTNGQIADPRVHIMQTGSFEKLREYILANSTATANQFKMPQKLKSSKMVEFMLKYELQ